MAKIKETAKQGLKREYHVTVPKDTVGQKESSRLEELAKTAKLPGFRPGKIPAPVIKQRFGARARAEALDQVVSEAAQKTLTEHKLRPAAQPRIELIAFAEDQDVEFKLTVETLPEITSPDFSAIVLERFVAEVEDKTIEDAIVRAAKAVRTPEPVTENRGARMGDVVTIDFEGSVGGKTEPGMKAEGHRLELGSKAFIPGFEEQLVGAKAGDKKTIKITFPADYHAAHLAGKEAEFAVEVKELRMPKPLVIDDALAKELGLPSVEKLRERVKSEIGASYANVSRAIIKRQLLDQLAAKQSFEVPAGMLDNEFKGIWQQVEAAKARSELPDEDKKKSDDELRAEYRAIAERRIRLGLLLAEVARRENIAVEEKELRGALIAEAQRFPGQEKAVIDYYTQTEGAIERLRAPLIEEKVVSHIIAKAKVTDKKVAAEELLKMPEKMQ